MFMITPQWFLVLAGTTLVHWLLPARLRGWWIVLASAAFLACYSPASLAILTALTVLLHLLAGRADSISGRRLFVLIMAAGSAFAFYKTHAALIPPALDFDPLTEKFIIPLGLSYYVLRVLHYAIEKYKGAIPAHGFSAIAQYLFFLPTFHMGPIHRFHAFDRDLKRKRWDSFMFAEGLERLMLGYFKMAFFAGFIANKLLNELILDVAPAGGHFYAYLQAVQNFANTYFMFAGGSDIAIGFGMLLGFRVMENFNFPLFARNISDFWARWHISLTSWCRDYIYMGTIALSRSPALASVAAMIGMGLWHEFSWRYLLWGFYQGSGILIWQRFQGVKKHLPVIENKIARAGLRALATLVTLHYVMIGMTFSRFDTVGESLTQIGKILFLSP